jgi:hypothetical protein
MGTYTVRAIVVVVLLLGGTIQFALRAGTRRRWIVLSVLSAFLAGPVAAVLYGRGIVTGLVIGAILAAGFTYGGWIARHYAHKGHDLLAGGLAHRKPKSEADAEGPRSDS